MISPRTKILLVAALILFCCFCFFVTEPGQTVLRGDISQVKDHWQLDDIYAGAGLAPWAFMFLPSMLIFIGGLLSLRLDRQRASPLPR